ncbi:MAG TPA: twin-arginine translocase TatA/TatE family subunit [Candidatus Methylomirabilis sp.]|jgi:sec-independent protein translocase protein TatA
MGGLGIPELLVIGVIALLVFGPKRLPDAGKALGQAIRGFKGAFEGKDESPEVRATGTAGRDCPGCGKAVDAAAAFCQHCGRTLSAAPKSGAS